MNTIRTSVLALVLTGLTTLAAHSSGFTITTNQVVDLSMFCFMDRVNTNWIGKPIAYALGNSAPKQIIVLLNNTEAPSMMHAQNVVSLLRSSTTLEDRPTDLNDAPPFFDCIAILENRCVVRVEKRREWARITTTEGRAYIIEKK